VNQNTIHWYFGNIAAWFERRLNNRRSGVKGAISVLVVVGFPVGFVLYLQLSISNIWLAARAESIGMGWVSFFQPDDLASLLSMPADSYPAAVLCIGYVNEFYSKPLLEETGWNSRRELDDILYENSWGNACSIL